MKVRKRTGSGILSTSVLHTMILVVLKGERNITHNHSIMLHNGQIRQNSQSASISSLGGEG
jgi:hypothetical protein